MITTTNNPPFRADQVGSLLRPAHLIEAREKYRKRLIDRTQLQRIEDDAIREVVKRQEAAGLQSISVVAIPAACSRIASASPPKPAPMTQARLAEALTRPPAAGAVSP